MSTAQLDAFGYVLKTLILTPSHLFYKRILVFTETAYNFVLLSLSNPRGHNDILFPGTGVHT
jgi:hypothetical protein